VKHHCIEIEIDMKTQHFVARLSGAILVAALVTPMPASAQFGGLFKKRPPASAKSNDDENASDCSTDPEKSIGKSILGNVIGDFTRRATRGLGVVGSYIPRAEVADTLTDSIACRLDPDEQLQAADATREVTRSEQVGSSSQWTSKTRADVSGSSTITEKTEMATGSSCMNLTDVVIVDGEETRVSKRMCKAPGESQYVIMV
jgi:surface antigen